MTWPGLLLRGDDPHVCRWGRRVCIRRWTPRQRTRDPVHLGSGCRVIAGRRTAGDVRPPLLVVIGSELVPRLSLIVPHEDFVFTVEIGEASMCVITHRD